MMEREDVEAIGKRILDGVIAHGPADARNYLIRVTSGTSGRAPLVLMTGYPSEAPNDMLGAQDLARMVSLHGSISSRLANVYVVSRVPEGKAMSVLSLDLVDLAPGLHELLLDYKPDVIQGFCSYIARVVTYIVPTAASNIRRIVLLGEMFTGGLEKILREKFPRAELTEKYMALEVGGYIGNRFCRFLPRNHFHPGAGITVEIADPDGEGIGDILISKTIFPSVRLERYRIGDIGRIVPKTCACGERVTFELLGRRGADYIKLAGALLTRDEFDRVLSRYPKLIDDYRVEVKGAGHDGAPAIVTLHIHRRAGAGTQALERELADAVSRSLFVTQTKTFHDLVDAGVFEPLEVRFTASPFTRGYKDVRLRVVES